MASTSNVDSSLDSMPVNKPPFFNGANYAYWKNMMMYFIQASDMRTWNIVEDSYIKPLTHPRLWSEGETRMMKPNEDIKVMTDRFSTIVNGLKSYGEIIPNEKLVRKLVYSLPKSWQSKKTAIIEAKNLKSLTLEELIGSLITHEMMLKDEVNLDKIDETPKEKEKKKNIGVALKSTKDDSDSDEDDDDEEMASFAKRFRKMMRPYRGRKFKRNEGLKNEPKEKDHIICYECKKPGHVKYDCPQLTRKGQSKNKHKAHVATWSDKESSDYEEQEVVNLCLMTFGEDSKEKEHCYKTRETNSNSWYLDSGCSRHMTGEKNRFIKLNAKNEGEVTFSDNSKGHIEGIININDGEHDVGEPSSKEEMKDEETQDPLENPTIEEREVYYPREYNYVKDGEIIGDPSKGLMQSEFEMSMMGELSFFLGLQIKQRKDDIFINQAKYIKDMLKKFGLENGKPHNTPMSSSTKLDIDEGDFNHALRNHLLAVKRIFRYLKDTPNLGLWYPRDSSFSLHAFSDANYGGCKLDRKSTSLHRCIPLNVHRFIMLMHRCTPCMCIDAKGHASMHPSGFRTSSSLSRSNQPPNPVPPPPSSLLGSCFKMLERRRDELYSRYRNSFQTYRIREECIPSLQAMIDINFEYLLILKAWKFDKMFQLKPIVYQQLVHIFYSNAVIAAVSKVVGAGSNKGRRSSGFGLHLYIGFRLRDSRAIHLPMGFRLLKDHCNYAVNSYFQRKGQAQHSCDFSGTTAVSPNPPPNVASTCSFPSSSTGANTGTTPNGTTTTGSTITGSTTRIPTTVFGGAGTTLGLKGTTSINDPSSVVGLCLGEEDEETIILGPSNEVAPISLDNCLVGRFLTASGINFQAMRVTLSNVCHPIGGISITELGKGLYLFRLYHKLDANRIMTDGVVGEFLDSNKRFAGVSSKIRVGLDVRKPLKRKKVCCYLMVKRVYNFSYEELSLGGAICIDERGNGRGDDPGIRGYFIYEVRYCEASSQSKPAYCAGWRKWSWKQKHGNNELGPTGMTHKYTSKEDKRWSGVSGKNINCPYKESLIVGLRIMWVGGTGAMPRGTMLGAKFEVTKFDGQGNFGLWQTRVKDLLAQQGILKALRPTKPASMDEEDWEELQQRAVGTIRLCLADEVMYHVMDLSSPDEIWRKLESQFMSKSLTTKLYLKQRMYGLKMQDDHDLAQHSDDSVVFVASLLRTHGDYSYIWERDLLHGVKSCKLDFCKYCVLGKQTKVRFKTAKHTTQGILDYVHSDVWGPSTTPSLGGSRYYVTFIDDFSRKVWVYFLKQKSEVFEKFKLWKAEERGIQRHFTVRKTPQHNGVVERMNRSLNERARCLRLNAGLPKHFWAEAVNMACYLINRSPRASLAGKVAEEVWTGHDISFDNLRIFGCPAYVHVPADEISKLDAKSNECIFLGYKKGVKGFKFWDPVAKKVVISRDVVFDEQSMLQQKQDTTVVDFEQFPFEKPETSQPTSGGSTTDDLQDYSLARDRVRRTNIKPPNILGFEDLVSFAHIVSSDDPVTFHDAVASQENDKWMAAMVEEMKSLNNNLKWELVPLPEGKKPIGYKCVYKKKPAVTEKEGEKFKARLLGSLVASWDLHLEQMDVKTAFLHGDLEEHIYMRQPEGFTQPGNEHLVCRLKKSLYGLKQSPRQWYKRFDSYMIKIGYNRCEYDCCVYVKSLDDGSFIFLLLYVDDMLIVAKNMDDVIGLKTLLSQEFDMKYLGAAKKILGMEICRDRDSRKLRLSQRGYVEKMLERFAMSSAKPVSTPLANHFKLSSEQFPKTDKEAEDMAKVPYSNAVGCLMYAMVCTRPDLAHVVSQVCKYMSKPGKQHWEAVKWIFRYLKGTVGHGIVFGSQRDNPLVVGYVDSDYAGDLDNRRSTTGYVFTLGGGPICWKSTIQSVVALSTTEAEYMEAAEAAKEALWLTGLVKELGVQQGGV
ncbi:hypothetical protein F3Y22_tig00110387pilonHSYRG00804 [Hibiscus syriacus]|uniref:Retrovirus-related Pol polyprotein from transposon TNT 1-94 n=1 Tax=Hibiscus syriacus TaxID=106335 RepID=A0A6A3AQW2_HIBSY|nr:hypothetical protein F3Y22_tig00110387pilonHSYRG00804 [Hibiscus syriacus]